MNYEHTGEDLNPAILHQWQPETLIRFNQENISFISEKICNDKNCKFRQVTLRIFNHLLSHVNNECRVSINAKQLSKIFGVHYDTITKSIKYLKSIDVIKIEK
jgi:Fic family protein